MHLDNFDIRLLRLFVTIVESGGFSAAQRKLGLYQSAISNKMNDLETRLGMKLCQRGRKGFQLTPEGRQVYDATLNLLKLIDQYEDELGDIKHVTFGHVRIGLSDNIATHPDCRLHECLRRFSQNCPNVSLSLEVCDAARIETLLLQGQLDIGVASSEKQLPGLSYQLLFSETQRLYAASRHPIFLHSPDLVTSKKILAYPIAGRGKAHPVTPLCQSMGMKSRAVSTHMEGTLHLLLSGEFIGYLPDHYARIWVERCELRPIPTPDLDYSAPFHLILARFSAHSHATATLIEEILAGHAATAGEAEMTGDSATTSSHAR
ncbi:LysR family transcriptional regulator [Paludibacterium purpuratum]|uniref:LysR family transcriptional regulator n=1 Tax=Paludibacterium purpuratum TaxID=1144873 RepID=A0A4V6PZB8_9NEIS|nr:LysR family transcriptional regulator [Paludibacterium purpuratum]TDR82659.1 LysR family transcriptional regulator [Paludibacterium purpuratum]